jgi:hypothetical protein
VRRRYYTVFRRIGVDDWLPFVVPDIAEHPDSGRTILEYARAFPMTELLVKELFAAIRVHGVCYQDLPILALETIATAPNHSGPELRAGLAVETELLARELAADARVPRSLADWMLASLIPLIGKFGNRAQQEALVDGYVTRLPAQCMARLQAFTMQVANGRRSTDVFDKELAGLPWSSVLTIDFVRAIERGDDAAVRVAMGLLQPDIRLLPNRYQIHSRPLLLTGLLARTGGQAFAKAMTRACARLRENPERLRDDRVVELLTEYAG